MEKHHSFWLLKEVMKNAAKCYWQQEVISTFQIKYVPWVMFTYTAGGGLRSFFGNSGPALVTHWVIVELIFITFFLGKD